MSYILKTMDGGKFTITDGEAKKLVNAKGMVMIKSCGSIINTASISTIFPESQADEIEDKKNQQTGVLHDGTLVKRHFGKWVDANNQVPDDKGNYQPLNLDSNYYPEIARDCVPTEKEFELKYRRLQPSFRLQIMLNGSNPERSGGMESVSKLLKDK